MASKASYKDNFTFFLSDTSDNLERGSLCLYIHKVPITHFWLTEIGIHNIVIIKKQMDYFQRSTFYEDFRNFNVRVSRIVIPNIVNSL